MKQLLIKIAYSILQKYSLEKLPYLYFNGKRYKVKSVTYKHATGESDDLTIEAVVK